MSERDTQHTKPDIMYQINDPRFTPGTKSNAILQESLESAKKYEARVEAAKANAPDIQAVKAEPVEWVEFEGTMVLRSGESRFVAVPHSGRKNSAKWHIINLDDRSDVWCTVTKKEVRTWLSGVAANEIKDKIYSK